MQSKRRFKRLFSVGLTFSPRPDDLPQVSYLCTKRQRGAVSFLPVPAQRQDTIARGDFGQWIIKHIGIWFAFARRLGLGIEQMEDIILVTGFHRTKSWANVAFLESHMDAQVSFGVEVTDADSPGSNIKWRHSPERVRGALLSWGPDGKVCHRFTLLGRSNQDRHYLAFIRIYPRINAYLYEASVSPVL
jgi:hypothetical protein